MESGLENPKIDILIFPNHNLIYCCAAGISRRKLLEMT
jgi:hypothetical protein